jgi:hypothetical protein
VTKRSHIQFYASTYLCSFLVGLAGAATQYVVVNMSPAEANSSTFEQIRQIATNERSSQVDLGLGAIFSYLNQAPEKTKARMAEFLALAEKYRVPIVVQLDGEQWWGARPDLWNWWDPDRPGYDPDNRNNVEWSGWGPEHALKIAWRNWGRQIRVLPPPNFLSQAYRQACHQEMRELVPLVLDWWQGLPSAKRHLLIGVKLGWESAIGVNSFYYPNGNALLDKAEADDPRSGLKADQIPDRGVTAIGYAAVNTAGLAHSGSLQEAHLSEIVRRHLTDLCALSGDLGLPRDRLFTHVAGWKEQELLYDTALNPYACPGWSFYKYAKAPDKDLGVQRVLQKSDAPYWAAVEWLLMGKQDANDWSKALERTLSDPSCRYMCIYNWRDIKNNPAALAGIQRVLGSSRPD